jgi:hypothetical protein
MKLMNRAKYGVGAAMLALFQVTAFAAPGDPVDLTAAGAAIDLTPVLTFGALAVAALVLLIPLRKAIKTANRT